MGLFDSFRPNEPLECPFCSKKTMREFQTKSLECMMYVFKVGDSVDYGESLVIKDGKVSCYTSCSHCDAWVEGYAVIKDGIFTRFRDVGKLGSKKDGWGE